ncbi:phage tail assembly chaperone [Burkholderia multivorans]|nr:phage tail assembly chaperone [Burkholderia multivorans]MBU9240677.1 phage tail assembly chaperone [Burkholderia multivorans]MBU9501891.1 phage tail assembly chaperone [Burkholderia multivorans]MBU9540276.1 phage tail assembly chaperone [Burkholderia multivorans]MBU9622925.1 phage tail assembly chaperone [Burkholderia multivorans]
MGQKYAAYDEARVITAFYDSVDSPPPSGAKVVPISKEVWTTLLAAQSRGKRLVVDESGNAIAGDPLPLTRAQVAGLKRAQRDAALKATDWLVSRHQDEKLIGDGTTLTAEQFAALLKYRQSLRESSELPGWPNVALPAPPAFINERTTGIE